MKILVVEDRPSELKLAHHVLCAAGHDVNVAEAAEQAFALIRSDRPELILLDLGLPGMDGLAFARKLKGDPLTHSIHLVAITSYPEEYSMASAMAAGCDAYLLKPLNTRKLSGQLVSIAGQAM